MIESNHEFITVEAGVGRSDGCDLIISGHWAESLLNDFEFCRIFDYGISKKFPICLTLGVVTSRSIAPQVVKTHWVFMSFFHKSFGTVIKVIYNTFSDCLYL